MYVHWNEIPSRLAPFVETFSHLKTSPNRSRELPGTLDQRQNVWCCTFATLPRRLCLSSYVCHVSRCSICCMQQLTQAGFKLFDALRAKTMFSAKVADVILRFSLDASSITSFTLLVLSVLVGMRSRSDSRLATAWQLGKDSSVARTIPLIWTDVLTSLAEPTISSAILVLFAGFMMCLEWQLKSNLHLPVSQ